MSTVTPGGRLVAERLGELAVDGVGAEAADEDEDAGVVMSIETDRGPVSFPSSRAELNGPRSASSPR